MKKLFSLMFIISLFSIIAFLIQDNSNLKKEVKSKIDNIIRLDSLNTLLKLSNEKKVEYLTNKDLIIDSLTTEIERIGKVSTKQSYPGFTFGENSISLQELLTITNNALKENQRQKQILDAVKKRYGIFYRQAETNKNEYVIGADSISIVQKYLDVQKRNQVLESELALNKNVLSFIKERFDLTYSLNGDKIVIPENKLDTLLHIYPLIKKRIKIKNGKIWLSPF